MWEGLEAGAERHGRLRWLGPLAPEGVRRARRADLLVEAIGRKTSLSSSGLGFDPDRGASGRPTPFYEHPGGAPVLQSASAWLSPDRRNTKLKWNGFYLTVEHIERGLRVYTIDLAPRTASEKPDVSIKMRQATQAALLVSSWSQWHPWDRPNPRARSAMRYDPANPSILHGSLHFMDADGYAVFTTRAAGCTWREIAEVAESAGLPLSVYVLLCSDEAAAELARLLFPPRRYCAMIF